jgi:DNA-binding HxlR family transcriptional regulator
MREYGHYCPVALGSEILAERWTPLILREMIAMRSTRFNEIERGLPGISRSLLVKRLKQLERRGVIAIVPAPGGHGNEYLLTPAGRDLEPVIMALGEWTVRWLYAEPVPEEVEPVSLMWWMQRRVDLDVIPRQRVVIQFDYRDAERTTLWMVLDRGEPAVCMTHPGFDPDIVVTTDSLSMMRVFSGVDDLAEARSNGRVRIDGLPRLVAAFPTWFLWSPFHDLVRERATSSRP